MKMFKQTMISLILGIAVLFGAVPGAVAATESTPVPDLHWPHEGMLGTFDRAALQRGFQVYKEVCASCHGLDHLAYRHLSGIGYNEAEIKSIAAQYTVMDGPNEKGQMFERPAKPSDPFVSPYPNEEAARYANGGALPPDMSLLVRARAHGEDYIYALLTGYEEPPADADMLAGQYWNRYFPGHKISMAPPLFEDAVEYDDGTQASVPQMARDVASFLKWASDPKMEMRKRMGVKVLFFLIIFTALMYAAKRRMWSDVH